MWIVLWVHRGASLLLFLIRLPFPVPIFSCWCWAVSGSTRTMPELGLAWALISWEMLGKWSKSGFSRHKETHWPQLPTFGSFTPPLIQQCPHRAHFSPTTSITPLAWQMQSRVLRRGRMSTRAATTKSASSESKGYKQIGTNSFCSTLTFESPTSVTAPITPTPRPTFPFPALPHTSTAASSTWTVSSAPPSPSAPSAVPSATPPTTPACCATLPFQPVPPAPAPRSVWAATLPIYWRLVVAGSSTASTRLPTMPLTSPAMNALTDTELLMGSVSSARRLSTAVCSVTHQPEGYNVSNAGLSNKRRFHHCPHGFFICLLSETDSAPIANHPRHF